MNPQNERGKRAEREAVKLLTDLLGVPVDRRRNAGIRLDVGDLIGVPDTCVQVTAAPARHLAVAQRARTKIIDCGLQQERLGARHGVTLIRIDGNSTRKPAWRALVSIPQFEALGWPNLDLGNPRTTLGRVITEASDWEFASFYGPGIIVASAETWAATWLAANATSPQPA